MPDFITICEQAARAGGKTLLDWRGRFTARLKGRADLVSEADLASQNVIRQIVLTAFPDHGFLGEEETPEDRITNAIITSLRGDFEYRWIVDPLDGTTNYVHGLAHYAVSIALEQRGRVIAGAVYDPETDEMFTAALGEGARLNGKPIRVSECTEVGEALIAASFAASVETQSREVQQFLAMLPYCQALRRMGSAALNLAYVACGRFDAYWSLTCKAWDIAAGVLLVEEAGGVISSADGTPLLLSKPEFAVSGNSALQRQILGILARVG